MMKTLLNKLSDGKTYYHFIVHFWFVATLPYFRFENHLQVQTRLYLKSDLFIVFYAFLGESLLSTFTDSMGNERRDAVPFLDVLRHVGMLYNCPKRENATSINFVVCLIAAGNFWCRLWWNHTFFESMFKFFQSFEVKIQLLTHLTFFDFILFAFDVSALTLSNKQNNTKKFENTLVKNWKSVSRFPNLSEDGWGKLLCFGCFHSIYPFALCSM